MQPSTSSPSPRLSEDWLAVIVGGMLLALCLSAIFASGGVNDLLKVLLSTPEGWSHTPVAAFANRWLGILGAGVTTAVAFGIAGRCSAGAKTLDFIRAFLGLFALATLGMVLSKQAMVAYYGLAYALWAIVIGLVIANTVGAPRWLHPAMRTELFMKVGLVLFGAEVLFGRLLELGLPGVCIAWVVTPIVLCATFWFGQRVLRIESPSLNMVVSADMSVCGVSAAIATAAACRAKKEELSLAIGLSMAFTVVMMLVLPVLVKLFGLGQIVGGAWIGGTIDATGAVAAAGSLLGEEALAVAGTIKMIQNILIGVVAFCAATYWVTFVERNNVATTEDADSRPGFSEIWRRFPKFIFGFLGASIVFSLLWELHPQGETIVEATIQGASKTLRIWCFCLAFVSIGLETNFRELAGVLRSGKPLMLYVCGQLLNLVLTLAMSLLVFKVLFPGAADVAAN